MDSYNKYDAILCGITLMIIPMLVGIFVLPAMTFASGIGAAVLIGVAMFVIPPTGGTTPSTAHTSNKGVVHCMEAE